ncbi:amidohydrolase family protein [Sphingosinicella terrae]|uniref:amidohydrolase family protein n=1 Tax=Sphingosinicella terrae TaxID=2172047 RepID=UPI000E0DA2BE|nr:amidohydrolase [Sphingosinicella terrae]
MSRARGCLAAAAALAAMAAPIALTAQPSAKAMARVADRQPGEGEGPFRRLVIRGAMMVDGSGAPPRGPVDIVIAGNRIEAIVAAGTPGLPLPADRPPRNADREIDASGMYVLPGFVDVHGHNGDPDKAPDAGYGYRLWLAHGVTTVRGVPLYSGRDNPSLDDRRRSQENSIVAPRLFAYMALGDGWSGGDIATPEAARAWVRWAAAQGYDGVKLFNDVPAAVAAAAIEESGRLRLGTIAHLGQGGVAEVNGDRAGAMGLGGITHFYGHFEALLRGRALPSYPDDYNMHDEQWRFGQVARLADQIVEPGGAEWRAYLERQHERGVSFSPTFNIYSASRDVMRARNADWHARYTLPSLQAFFAPSRTHHGSYFWDWTTADEIAWRRFYVPYMRLMNDYKNMGGRVTVGSDPGFIYQSWGFSYVAELEMLQEAGFSPLETIQAATINGAREIYAPRGEDAPFGLVREGMLADLVIVPENPLANFKLLYGTGHMRLNPRTQQAERVGGVRWTIKDGIVYDAPALLASVERMVESQRAALEAAP